MRHPLQISRSFTLDNWRSSRPSPGNWENRFSAAERLRAMVLALETLQRDGFEDIKRNIIKTKAITIVHRDLDFHGPSKLKGPLSKFVDCFLPALERRRNLGQTAAVLVYDTS